MVSSAVFGASPTDTQVWDYARREALGIATKDADLSGRIIRPTPPTPSKPSSKKLSPPLRNQKGRAPAQIIVAKLRFFGSLWGSNATSNTNTNFREAMADARRTLESSAHYTRGGGAPAPDHDADHPDRTSRIEAEQQRLIRWAKENGKLGAGGRLPPEFSRGGEHQVYFHEKKQRYLKATLLERQLGYGIALGSNSRGATPSEYLDRLDLQNQIFNDDIRLERVVLKNGKPIIVTSQPAIKGVAPTQAALNELMAGKGFERLADGAYYDEGVGLLIFDLFPRNAIQAANGVIFPIDPVIQRVTPEFGQFLREHPYTINLY